MFQATLFFAGMCHMDTLPRDHGCQNRGYDSVGKGDSAPDGVAAHHVPTSGELELGAMPRHLITGALTHPDGIGRLGTLAGSLLPADVYCRFLRARGEEVLFVCASGEDGTDSELVAATELAAKLGLSFDVFGRSSSPRSAEQTQYFARRLEQEGYIDARPTGQLLLLQSRLAGELRAWLEAGSDLSTRSICLDWLDRGVEDWSITCDLNGGIPVDRTGFEGVAYEARFNAPIAYIGATREWAEARGEPGAWRRWWRASDDVRYVQFMTSEDVPTHTVCFPCTLIGSREAWKLADVIKAFDPLTYYGDRSPAAAGNSAFMDSAVELLAVDCWRYGLLASAPEAGEESFSWEALAGTVNADLVEIVAGFVDRALGFAAQHFGPAVPSGGAAGHEEEWLVARMDAGIEAISARVSALKFRQAVAELRAAWELAGHYLERKRPWGSLKVNRDDVALTARVCLNLVSLLARLSAPLMPFTAERLLDALGVPLQARAWPDCFEAELLGAGHRFSPPPTLFQRVEGADIAHWRARLGRPESRPR
jgi:methionyl-tRNA synthetase